MADSFRIRGTPTMGLLGASLGFFIGFAGVSLFGPTAKFLTTAASLTPAAAAQSGTLQRLAAAIKKSLKARIRSHQ